MALFAIAVLIATTTGAPVSALAVGDSWTYVYHQAGAVEWLGNLTERYVGVFPGNLLGIRVNGSGQLTGDVNGTWNLAEFNGYRGTDGAFVNSTSTLVLQYVEFGDAYYIVDVSETFNEPPVDLGGPLQVGSETTGTTTQFTTRTMSVNGNTTGPTTTSAPITITRRIVAQIFVTVPAGTFRAWQIRYTSSDSAGYVEHAYNETVGSSVRIQVFDEFANVAASLELKSWSLGPGGAQGTPAGLPTSPLLYAAIGGTAAFVAAVVWWDRRRRPTPGLPGSEVPQAPPPSPPPQPP